VWRFDATRLSEALRVRDAVARLLAQAYPGIEQETAWIVVTELITNVVRHAPGRGEVRLENDGGRAAIHVLDEGSGEIPPAALPANPLSESGRGLFIVANLAHGFSIRRRPDGGAHAIAVLA